MRSRFAVKLVFFVSIGSVLLHVSGFPAGAQRRDVLGAHANFGRGCPACHLSHSPSIRNGDGSVFDTGMLWGKDVAATYKATGGNFLLARPTDSEEKRGLLLCLSCHAGDYAPAAMMRNRIYEPVAYGLEDGNEVPTFTEQPNEPTAIKLSHHPVGVDVRIGCGGAQAWDCFRKNGVLNQGSGFTRFTAHYGYFLEGKNHEDSSLVCTTCHNPHSMNLTHVTTETASEVYPPGVYATKYFLRAPYSEGPPSRRSNISAQFCRQCHAELSNEMNGSTAGTVL